MRSFMQLDFLGLHLELPIEPASDRKSARRARPASRKKNNQELGESIGQIPIPLSLSELLPKSIRTPNQTTTEVNNDYQWTMADMEKIHDRLLTHSLHLITDRRASQASVTESIEWLFAPIEFTTRPFTFKACCQFGGYDPFELQDRVRFMVKKIKRGVL